MNIKKTIKPYDLKCEHLVNPIGIDTLIPRFNWKISDSNYTRGQKQVAYRVLVSSNILGLDNNYGDLWDSGIVESSQSNLIEYKGAKLISCMNCFWKVKVWDKDVNESDWSISNMFSIGLLENSYWKGNWITAPNTLGLDIMMDHIWYRKIFFMDSKNYNAYAYIASIGYHELYINGQKVDSRVLAPSQSRIEDDKRVYYVTYDISNKIIEGSNVIALWTAAGWARYKNIQTPGFICQVYFSSSVENLELHSDSSWKFQKSSSSYIDGWKWGDFGGEIIDSGNYYSNWNEVTYDDISWGNAVEFSCKMIKSADTAEPDRVIETIMPVSISGEGPYVVDMGINYTGWLKIDLKNGIRGRNVTFKIADKNTEGITFNQQYKYVYDSSGEGFFCNRFNYFAGRYITIEGLSYKPSLLEIKGYAIGNDLKRTGWFSCSNNLINRIYETDLHTFMANTLNGVTVDCPHRERLGYGESGHSTTWGCGLTSYDSAAFYTRMLQNWRDVQMENGYIYHVAPNHNGGGGTAWSSYPVFGAWEVYKVFNDKRILEDNYPTIKKWLYYLHSNVSEGILQSYENEKWGFLGDWATPHGDEWGDTKEALMFNNCVYVYVLDIGVRIAHILGLPADESIFSIRLKDLRENIHCNFFDKANSEYIDKRQLHLAMPLYTKITPDSHKEKVLKNLENEIRSNTFFDTGSPGLVFLLKSLMGLERNDLVYECLNKDTYPGFGHFIRLDQTTWPEMWDMRDIYGGSRIHTCYTGIAGWIVRGIGGIMPNEEYGGYKNFSIKPWIPRDVDWVNTQYESPYGIIKSNWTKSNKNNTIELHVEIPANTMAKIYIPSVNYTDIKEGGVGAVNASGLQFVKTETEYSVFKVGSGKYCFNFGF